MKYFNIAGPCNSAKHYMIDASTRLKGVEQLIDTEQYFVIHAARQSGKTTYLHDLLQRLNAGGKYYSLCCSLETVQGIIDPKDGIPAIIRCIRDWLISKDLPHNSEFVKDIDYSNFNGALRLSLSQYCKLLDKPFVLLFDEADCLSEGTLITFLRQLRNGYNNRSVCCFVHSIALVGMCNIRDYKAQIRPDSKTLGSSSPFNIVAESLTLQNFTKDEIIQLYQQHTDETGQIFNDDAIELIFEQTQG
ncbi:MAG: hypothetical protein LBB88_05715, partial [Planctomycetaceae bacterium]|nr:hypothetical protein [Planctomycetaceae bacterium]